MTLSLTLWMSFSLYSYFSSFKFTPLERLSVRGKGKPLWVHASTSLDQNPRSVTLARSWVSVPDFLICNQNHLKELPKMRKTYPSIYSSSCCGAGIPSAVIIMTWIFGCFSWCELCCWFASGRNMWIWPSLCPLLLHTTKTPALVGTERERCWGLGRSKGGSFPNSQRKAQIAKR